MTQQARIRIPPGHPAFAGHFPSRPILPGVVLLQEAARHIADGLVLDAEPVWGLNRVKFFQPALPGDQLDLSWSTTETGDIRFRIERTGEVLAEGVLRSART
ncbi:hypothetical protein [Thiorhodococcus minor]|uniref:ApeI dehydratase-like domain-containing protein n=1 Tax=Thiorhodococcus minor TaxID=57489 RepID=A0A6M0K147_9GAMM|nr:hypothetical protein [Thiorhodococcus minor]NEV63478.1 hypothetical protein [Thiorhodococcus minor]